MRHFLATSAVYGASATSVRLVAAAITIWIATRVSINEYGRFGLLLALQQFVAIVTLGGLVESVIGLLRTATNESERARLYQDARRTFIFVAAVFLLLSGTYAAVAFQTSFHVAEVLSAVAGGIVLAYATLAASLARLEERHSASVVLSTVPQLAGFIGGFLAVSTIGTLAAFFCGSAISCGISIVVLRRTGRSTPVGVPSAERRREIRQLFAASIPFAGAALFGWLSGLGNTFVIDRFYPPEEVGLYTLAFSIASAVHMVAAALNSVWMPRFYRLASTLPIDVLEDANRAFYNMLAVALGAVGGGLIVAFPLLGSWLEGRLTLYAGVEPRLIGLIVGYVIVTTWWQCSNHLLANGAGRVVLRVTVTTGIVGTFAWIGLMLALGPLGIYAGFVLMMGLRSFFLKRATREFVRTRWPWEGTVAGCGLVVAAWLASLLASSWALEVLLYGVLGMSVFAAVARRDVKRCLAVW